MTYILSDKIRTARKFHHCDQCGGSVNPGDRYREQVNTYDGFGTYRAHEDCDTASNEYRVIAKYEDCRASDIAGENRPWLEQFFPSVAKRFFAR
jgi:hypothetical protein